MPITKKQAENNLEQAVCAKLVDVVAKIDEKLKNHYSGDIALFKLSDLDLTKSISSNSLRNEIISRLTKIYKDAGWEVSYNDRHEFPNIVLK